MLDTYMDVPEELTDEETTRYLELYRCGDMNAKNKLIEHNLKLIVFIIKTRFKKVPFNYPSITRNDLISMCVLALNKAIETYDSSKNFRFSTYAANLIINQMKSITISLARREKREKRWIQEGLFIDMISRFPNPEDYYIRQEEKSIIREALDILTPLARLIIELGCGFKGQQLNQTEIAELLGCTRANVSLIERRAKEKLKKYLTHYGFIPNGSSSMDYVRDMNPYERAKWCAELIINTDTTIESLAFKLGVSVKSLRQSMFTLLQKTNRELIDALNERITKQKKEKRIALTDKKNLLLT